MYVLKRHRLNHSHDGLFFTAGELNYLKSNVFNWCEVNTGRVVLFFGVHTVISFQWFAENPFQIICHTLCPLLME